MDIVQFGQASEASPMCFKQAKITTLTTIESMNQMIESQKQHLQRKYKAKAKRGK